LLCSLLVVDFGDDEWPLSGKEFGGPAEDFILTAFHIYLDQLRQRPSSGNEIIERDRRDIHDFTRRQHWTSSIGFNTSLRPGAGAAAKRNSTGHCTRPYGSVHNLKPIFESVLRRIRAQALNIFGIAIEGNHSASGANQPGSAKSHDAYMSANVVEDGSRPKCRGNCHLDLGLVLPSPEETFSGNCNLHPHSLRQAGLNLHPGLRFSEETAPDQTLKLLEPFFCGGPPPQPAVCHRRFKDDVHPVKQQIEARRLIGFRASHTYALYSALFWRGSE